MNGDVIRKIQNYLKRGCMHELIVVTQYQQQHHFHLLDNELYDHSDHSGGARGRGTTNQLLSHLHQSVVVLQLNQYSNRSNTVSQNYTIEISQ